MNSNREVDDYGQTIRYQNDHMFFKNAIESHPHSPAMRMMTHNKIIRHAAKVMNEEIPNVSFYVDVYTDNVGSAARNKTLSRARAQSVVNALVMAGVAKNRLVARGFGKEHPLCTNATAEGRQCNRRVEVLIRNVNQTDQKNSLQMK